MAWWKWSAGVVAVLVVLTAVLFWALFPPALPVPPQTDMVISGVTVINPGAGRTANQTIVVHKGRIIAVRSPMPGDPPPVCKGCFAIPGLIDAHVHTPPSIVIGNQRLFALLYLEYGVTSVRDMGQSDSSVHTLADALNSGEIVGPHMYRCGPVLDGDPVGWPSAVEVRNAAEGKAAVDALTKENVDCIKVYNEITQASYDGIAAEAAHFGIPVVGHVPHRTGLTGVHDFEAQHLTGVPYLDRPLPPPGTDLRGEDIMAMTDAEIDHALDVTIANRISVLPTLANSELRLIASDPKHYPPTPASHVLPDFWGPVWNVLVNHPTTRKEIAAQPAVLAKLRAITARAHDRGIDVLAGTDTIMPWIIPGESLLMEIDRLAQSFHSSEEALKSATAINAKHIAPGQIGIIAPGARADILLLPSDPIHDLRALRQWRIEIVDGRRYNRAAVDGWVENYRRHFHSAAYSTVMNAVSSILIREFANRW